MSEKNDEAEGASGQPALRDGVGTATRMAIHALLPLERHDEARELLVEVYSRNVGASPEHMRARLFEVALTIELGLDDDDWSRIEKVIAYLTNGRWLGHA